MIAIILDSTINYNIIYIVCYPCLSRHVGRHISQIFTSSQEWCKHIVYKYQQFNLGWFCKKKSYCI